MAFLCRIYIYTPDWGGKMPLHVNTCKHLYMLCVQQIGREENGLYVYCVQQIGEGEHLYL